jgi:hypothetical protein
MPRYGGGGGAGNSGGVAEVFARSWECFGQVTEFLAGAEAGSMPHERLEEELTGRGRELMRLLLQDHLDLRAACEERRHDVTGPDGAARTRAEPGHARALASVHGQVMVTRIAYRAPGAANVHPADAALNLPEGKYSHGLARVNAIEAARGSFADAADAVWRASGLRLGLRQCEELARRAAADVDAFYQARRPGPAPAGHALALTFDGKGIVMRREALRPATAKAAAAASRKLAARLSPGEKNGRKRMAELAGVYDFLPVARSPGDIIAPPGGRAARPCQEGPKAKGKWLNASVADDMTAVIAAGFDEAGRRDPRHECTWIALVDGNRDQIAAIEAEAAARGADITIIVDFIHVTEYVWKAAWSFFEPGDPDAGDWVADKLTRILQGKAASASAGIRRRATRFGFSGAERAGADTCAAYLDAKRPYLAYRQALAEGWPIATGVIEGACRHLVKDRMDITGARWGLASAEAILKLRAVISNGDFDDYWAYHLKQEQHRNHDDIAA